MKKRILVFMLTLFLLLGMSPVNAADTKNGINNGVYGGWDEKTGYFTSLADYNNYLVKGEQMSVLSEPQHTGKRERYDDPGQQTYFRAHGWTTWVGEYHYTRARMESGGVVLTDSERQWGWNGTEAISPWWAFDPNIDEHAKTYYGR